MEKVKQLYADGTSVASSRTGTASSSGASIAGAAPLGMCYYFALFAMSFTLYHGIMRFLFPVHIPLRDPHLSPSLSLRNLPTGLP